MDESLIVTRIRNYILGLTEISGHPNTDFSHAIHVSENMQLLASLRHLDEDDAELIGWLHDIGRMKSLGDPHGETGAKEAERLLRHYELDEEKIKLISHAIYQHSNKDELDGPYDEMIKDADSMAHEYDHEELDEYEKFRALNALEPSDELTINYDPDILEHIIHSNYQSMSAIHLNDFSKKIRAIIWLIKKHDCMSDELKKVKSHFKELKKLTESCHKEAIIEKHQVLSDIEISDDLDQLIKYRNNPISLDSLNMLLSLDIKTDKICEKFMKRLKDATIEDEVSLERLKSGSKHIYQLVKMDILQCNNPELIIGLYETLDEWLVIRDFNNSKENIKLQLFKMKKSWL